MGWVFIVGVGPGCPELITPEALEAVEKADLLVGGRRQLDLFPHKKKKIEIGRGHWKILGTLEKRKEQRIAVLTSGDPGFYSILTRVRDVVPPEKIIVIPGLSSMQVAFARIGLPWHDSDFLSVHGRSLGGFAKKVKGSKKIAILTDPRHTPGALAKLLTERGMGSRKAFVCEELCTSDERIMQSRVSEITGNDYGGYSVMVIIDE